MKSQTEPDAQISQLVKTALRRRLENNLDQKLLTGELIKSLSGRRDKEKTNALPLTVRLKISLSSAVKQIRM